MERQAKLLVWETDFVSRLRQLGHNHGIIGKARVALAGFLADPGFTRPPYYPVEPPLIDALRQDFARYWSASERAG